jgi:hypothetical protein
MIKYHYWNLININANRTLIISLFLHNIYSFLWVNLNVSFEIEKKFDLKALLFNNYANILQYFTFPHQAMKILIVYIRLFYRINDKSRNQKLFSNDMNQLFIHYVRLVCLHLLACYMNV